MSKKAFDVVVAGHICLDIIPDLTEVNLESPAEFFRPGKLMQAGAATLSTGGPVSNTGLNLVKLGIPTALMGKVGDDRFGDIIRFLLKSNWGVSKGMIIDKKVTTSYTVTVTPHGFDRMFIHDPGANRTFKASDIDYDLVAKARLFHLGYPPLMDRLFENDGKELVKIYKKAKKLGLTTGIDMCVPDPSKAGGQANWGRILEQLMPYVDFYMGSAEETLYMLERDRFFDWRKQTPHDLLHLFTGDDMNRLSGKLLDLGGKVLCLKSGYRGYYVRTTPDAKRLAKFGAAAQKDMGSFIGREFWYPTYHIDNPPQATGSGDSSIAGFYAAYLRGLSLDETVKRATATGALNCTKPDAISGILPWPTLEKKLKAGWALDPLEVEGAGWQRDPSVEGRWIGPAETKV